MKDLLFAYTRVWTGDLCISSSALYHCATVISGFHLWQFQVVNSGAEGLVVVLFSLDTCERFSFCTSPGFQLGTSGSLDLHSTTVPQQLLVFTSDNFRYLTLLQRDWWWYCSDWTCERFSFLPTPGFELGTSASLVLLSTTVPHGDFWFSPLTISSYLTLLQRDWWWYCSDWTCERFSYLHTPGFELGTSACLVLHSTTVPQQCLVFTSDNFRYLSLVQREYWWYCSHWTCERFSFCPHQGFNWGPLNL